MKKKNKWKWAAALVLGIVLAVLFEGIIALYRVNRGYGNEKTAFLLAAESGNDYVVGENGTLWVKTGIQPYMLFHLKEDLGHVHIRFKEPLAQEMNISCYYAQSDAFHVLQQKNAYLVEGTTEAFFSVPFGNWDSYRLGIDGDFVLESIEGVKSVPLSQIKTEQVLLQANGVRFILFLLLFVCGGLFLAEKREGRKKKQGKRRKAPDGLHGRNPCLCNFYGDCRSCVGCPGKNECSPGTKRGVFSVFNRSVYLHKLQPLILYVKRGIASALERGEFFRFCAETAGEGNTPSSGLRRGLHYPALCITVFGAGVDNRLCVINASGKRAYGTASVDGV